jgi:excinuclease ABC subunit B
MRRALDETDRRRATQVLYNEEHGITPKTIIKQVADVMEAAYPVPGRTGRAPGDKKAVYEVLSPEQLLKRAAQLEKKMLRHARDLEFEEAAKLRDEIQSMRAQGLGIGGAKAG